MVKVSCCACSLWFLSVLGYAAPPEDEPTWDDEGGLLKAEIAPDLSESLAARDMGIGVFYGRVAPHLDTGVIMEMRYDDRHRHRLLLGRARTQVNDILSSGRQVLGRLDVHQIAIDRLYLLTDQFPFVLRYGAGFYQLGGQLTPRGTNIDKDPAAALPASVTGAGVSGFASFDLAYIWENGMLLTYTVFGLGVSPLLRFSQNGTQDEIATYTRSLMKQTQWYGLMNISIAWLL